jgi:hypothetical protein
MTAVLGLALAVPVLVVATGFKKPVSAADVNTTIQYQDVRPNPCPPNNPVQLNGKLHTVVTYTATPSGSYDIYFKHNSIGLTGNDLVTQDRYVASDTDETRDRFSAGPPFPVTHTEIVNHELVSQGNSPNFVMHITFRVRIDAPPSVPTVLVDNIWFDCKG